MRLIMVVGACVVLLQGCSSVIQHPSPFPHVAGNPTIQSRPIAVDEIEPLHIEDGGSSDEKSYHEEKSSMRGMKM